MKRFLLLVAATFTLFNQAFSQAELSPWGNINGIRKQGHLLKFETALQYIKSDGVQILTTARERQRPVYSRNGSEQTVRTNLDSLYFEETVSSNTGTKARVNIKMTAHADTNFVGAFFIVKLPLPITNSLNLQLIGESKIVDPASLNTSPIKNLTAIKAKGFELKDVLLNLKVESTEQDSIFIRKDENTGEVLVYFTLREAQIKKGEVIQKSFDIEASGEIDRKPAEIKINTQQQGRSFDGLGGNFRLQNPTTDPLVIDYSLNNLRLAWGRVEMPWRYWQPVKDNNPLDAARQNQLPSQVTDAMQMAQRLNKLGIPVIVSAWSAPDWAIEGTYNEGFVNGIWGNPLRKDVMTDIYRSLTRYLTYLKDNYGVEARYFSFNESDLGINVRMTATEHAEFIKGFGAYLDSKGIKTKLLLGDNSDANSWSFLNAAMSDAAAKPYIGAVSFHSWRGWETETLKKWADASTQLHVPLLVSEGSIDASAWQYPVIFQEPWYAIDEINLYLRLLNICQPASILQWQLTADYSPLAGGGIFGDNSPLRPTQRFWNLKQLSSTPKSVFALPATSNNENITCAALGSSSTNVYALHLVNNGAERVVTVTGLPNKLLKFKVTVTNAENNAKELGTKKSSNGQIQFKIPARSFVTLSSE
ncbi:glycoside hydrolase [Mucilaginibacter aquatilis]|uniref:O-glycosyl hydrolase n=1 Tax=Mucilaginibacter aquatilis TaxID=1517760 RepID=A0A6I4IEZ2_9SPHI|nr:hypothetical protein [Mucilaginibacter aquatilis]MVN91929.1 hypothetical protein [Mucilaginibacter aquatilis]